MDECHPHDSSTILEILSQTIEDVTKLQCPVEKSIRGESCLYSKLRLQKMGTCEIERSNPDKSLLWPNTE